MTDLNIGIEDFIHVREAIRQLDMDCCRRTAVRRLAKAETEPLAFNAGCIGITGSDLAALQARAAVLGVTVDRMLRGLTKKQQREAA